LRTPLRISFRWAVWIVGLFAGLYFIVLVGVRDDYLRILFSDIYFPVQKLLAVAVLFYVARSTAPRYPKLARSWYLWMFATASYAIAAMIWMVDEIFLKREPFPSTADFFYLLFYPLMWLGLANYPEDESQGGGRKLINLDNVIVVIGSGLVMWVLTISPTVNYGETDLLSFAISVLYPVLGMVLLWGVFIFFRTRMQQSVHLPVLLIGIGLVGEITSDTLFAINYEIYTSGSWIDLGWVFGGLFIVLAGILHLEYLSKEQGDNRETNIEIWLRHVKSWPIYVPYLWVGLAYTILVTSLPIEREKLYLVVGIGILIALVIFRQVLTITENEHLFQQAQQELHERKLAQEALHQANLVLDQRVQERTFDFRSSNQRLSEVNTALELEIVERKQAEELLQRQIKIEELIATISASFINLPDEDIDLEIERSLQLLGEFVEADRSYIFQFFKNNQVMSNTYEWCRSGVEVQKANLQMISVASFPWWMDKLNSLEAINISSLLDIPIEAQSEKSALEAQGIQSLIVVPLESNQSLVGFFGFDAVREPKHWKGEEITLIKIAGEILVTALQRKASQEALARYSRRLKTLYEIDQAILAEESNANIVTHALHSLFDLVQCRGGALVAINRGQTSADLYILRDEQNVQSISINESDHPEAIQEMLQAVETLSQDEGLQGHKIPTIIYQNLFTTEPLDVEERSLMAVPVSQQDRTCGFLCLRLPSTKDLTPDQDESIREVAHSLAIALQQAQLRLDLQRRIAWTENSLHDKEILLKEIHHRVKNNLQIISSLLNLQAQVVQDPSARSALQDSQMRVRSMALIHEKLYQSENLSQILLGSYIKSLTGNLFHSYQKDIGKINLVVQAQEIITGIDYALPIGLILNELISNSLKHAFPGNRCGEIGIALQREIGNTVLLRYYDTGVGLPEGFNLQASKSLGTRLIYSLAMQLNAEIEVFNHAGVKFDLRLPIESDESISSTPEPA